MNTLNPLRLPLTGRQVIEASAGTGKTWTLAALYLRLVLGHGRADNTGLGPRQILVMTFTEAATAELRERIRKRLHDAAVWFDKAVAGSPLPDDDFLQQLSLDMPSVQWPLCARRLHLAAQAMDEAAIYTIHGWSRRMLSSFALLSRDLFEQTHLDNPNELLLQLVRDHWRQWFYPLPPVFQNLLLTQLGSDPQDLLKQLQPIWKKWDVLPPPQASNNETETAVSALLPVPVPSPKQVLSEFEQWQSAYQSLQAQARQAWQMDMPALLLQACKDGLIKDKGRRVRVDWWANWVNELQDWAEHGSEIRLVTLERFTAQKLEDCGWAKAADFEVFHRIGEVVAFAQSEPACKTQLIEHTAHAVRQAYQQAKLNQSVFDFNDLLQRLHQSLHSDKGELADAIRGQYPVAMVDEFQDTDPWQYESLDRIYRCDGVNDDNALVMIGDPKQAIYSFRGADLNTYLKARATALVIDPQACHTLDTNYRSTPGLVNAVNHMFGGMAQPFRSGDKCIEFIKVQSAATAKPLQDAQGQALPPLTLWHLPLTPDVSDKPYWPADLHVNTMAAGFATQMVKLLQAHADIHPGQMAVLVRSHAHAQAMQAALSRAGLPSVFLSDHANVYQSPQATDLWRVLRAISMPRNSRWLRSAMAGSIWGWNTNELVQAMHKPELSDALAESCQQWLQLWQQHGVLPMLYQWMHSQGIAQRLIAQPLGQRSLTNLLHLGELLQTAAAGLQGPQALLQFLAQQIQAAGDNPEEQKMRLETDAHCVQVVTFHKSKGLEYPLVFVPFLGSFKTGPGRKDDEEDSDITESSVDEDMRLLYVALTRAKRGMWLGLAATSSGLSGKGTHLKLSAVSALLQRQSHDDLPDRLQALFGDVPDIAIAELPAAQDLYFAPVEDVTPAAPALTAQRQSYARWWTASFSSLTRGLEAGSQREEAHTDASIDAARRSDTGDDGTPTVSRDDSNPWQSFPKGASYGSLLHDLLEWQAQQGWPLANGQNESAGLMQQTRQQAWQQMLNRKTRGLNLPERATGMLPGWLQTIISTPLPLDDAHQGIAPLVLQQLTPSCQWPEMGFHLSADCVSSARIDRLIQHHVLPGQPRPALQPRVLQGMLTGFMDLVFEHQGRYWVLDYKSNWLDTYDSESLNAAVLDKRYDVQYVLYLLALHRLLSSRLPNYNYDTHIGGAVYVFLRGIQSTGAGVHGMKPPFELIVQLDSEFAGRTP